MTGRRKGTPCACETDPCSCGSSKGKCIRTINNLSPDPNGDFFIEAGSGITITQTSDNGFEVSFDGTLPSNPLIYKGTVGSGGTVAVLPAADPDNIGWCYIAIEAATTPVTYEVGDVLISDGYTWQVVPSGDEIINIVTSWQATPDDQHVPSEKLVKDSLDGKVDKLITPIVGVYAHTSATQNEIRASINAGAGTVMLRNSAGRSNVKDVSADTDSDEIINVRTLNRRLTDGSVSKIGTANVGSDTKPIKLVAGVPTAVTDDLVSTTGAQTVAGVKTFTDIINETANYPSIIMKSNVIGITDRVGTAINPHSISFQDKNGAYAAGIIHRYYTDGAHRINMEVYSENSNLKQFNFWALADGTTYATVPNRTYNASNTTDIVNIALLDGYTPMLRTSNNQVFTGIKKAGANGFIRKQSGTLDLTTPPAGTVTDETYVLEDKNGVTWISDFNSYTENSQTIYQLSTKYPFVENGVNKVTAGAVWITVYKDKMILFIRFTDKNGTSHLKQVGQVTEND